MNYDDLKQNIKDICENTFTDSELAMFTQQAEQKIYNTVQMPALRTRGTGNCIANSFSFTMPADFLWIYSFGITDAENRVTYLLNKDVNFMDEAYPNDTYVGLPKYYAYYNQNSIIFGPTPDSTYAIFFEYGRYPQSISISPDGTSWLGEAFDSALLNGALVEAIRFMKGEPDLMAVYEKMYLQALSLLKGLSDGKLRQDSYRSGQLRIPPT